MLYCICGLGVSSPVLRSLSLKKGGKYEAELVLIVLEMPEPMNVAEAEAWESVNRPSGMTWLKVLEPVGALPALLWEATYERLDAVTEGLCS